MKPEQFDAILAKVGNGDSVRQACSDSGINRRVFFAALNDDEGMANRYARAKEAGLEAMADDTLGISDDPEIDPQHKRIMVDTRKWLLSKLAPKRYGEKLDLNHGGQMTVVLGADDARLL